MKVYPPGSTSEGRASNIPQFRSKTIITGTCVISIAVGTIIWTVWKVQRTRHREKRKESEAADSSTEGVSLELPPSPPSSSSSMSHTKEVAESQGYRDLVLIFDTPALPSPPWRLADIPEDSDMDASDASNSAESNIAGADPGLPVADGECDLAKDFYLKRPWSPQARRGAHRRSWSATVGNRTRTYSEYTAAPPGSYGTDGDCLSGETGNVSGARDRASGESYDSVGFGRATRSNSSPAAVEHGSLLQETDAYGEEWTYASEAEEDIAGSAGLGAEVTPWGNGGGTRRRVGGGGGRRRSAFGSNRSRYGGKGDDSNVSARLRAPSCGGGEVVWAAWPAAGVQDVEVYPKARSRSETGSYGRQGRDLGGDPSFGGRAVPLYPSARELMPVS